MRALSPAGQVKQVERDGRLFSSGDAAGGVYLIVKGTARATLVGDERELMCRTAGPGAVLGLTSALCAKQYQFDVQALEPVEAVFLETGTVNEILRGQPELCMRAMRMMCDELEALRQTREHYAELRPAELRAAFPMQPGGAAAIKGCRPRERRACGHGFCVGEKLGCFGKDAAT